MRPSASGDFAMYQKATSSRPSAADLQLTKKKAAAGSASWMKIDGEGGTLMLDADKYAIMHRVGIHARDLRILDPLLSYPSTILGRERAIVLNLEHIKAIITADEVLLRNATSQQVAPFVRELQRRVIAKGGVEASDPAAASDNESDEEDHGEGEHIPLRTSANEGRQKASAVRSPIDRQRLEEMMDAEEDRTPFEFQALEVALDFTCRFLEARTEELENAAYPALDALTSKISSLNLERVRKLKNGLSRLSARVQKVRDELEQLLDDDEDMADMFLTRKAAPPPSQPGSAQASPTVASRISRGGSHGTYSTFADDDDDIEDLEQLLEAYFMQVDETHNKLNTLREYIDDTEDYINIQLDNHRNQLIQLELVLNTGAMIVAVYSVVVGVFGMNIPFDWNTYDSAFSIIVIVTTSLSVIVYAALLTYARYKRIIS